MAATSIKNKILQRERLRQVLSFSLFLCPVKTIQNSPDSSGRADLDTRHFQKDLHLRPLTDSRPFRHYEAFYRSLLMKNHLSKNLAFFCKLLIIIYL